jgi:integrase
VLAIPSKRFTRTLVRFLTRPEVDALLAAPDRRTWFGRRDHGFILMAVQTGLRLSEITAVKRDDLVLEAGAHVRVIGKGRVCFMLETIRFADVLESRATLYHDICIVGF